MREKDTFSLNSLWLFQLFLIESLFLAAFRLQKRSILVYWLVEMYKAWAVVNLTILLTPPLWERDILPPSFPEFSIVTFNLFVWIFSGKIISDSFSIEIMTNHYFLSECRDNLYQQWCHVWTGMQQEWQFFACFAVRGVSAQSSFKFHYCIREIQQVAVLSDSTFTRWKQNSSLCQRLYNQNWINEFDECLSTLSLSQSLK